MKSYKNSNDVITEPILQTLTGVELSIGNKVSMEARADISARGFGVVDKGHCSMRSFDPNTQHDA